MKNESTDPNANLNKAKIKKDNELYTGAADISKEILSPAYDGCFRNKSVICNCNDTSGGGFWRAFRKNFETLGLSRLTVISYDPGGRAIVSVWNGEKTDRYMLNGDGSFDSPECLQLLDESDIACTNPPFSLFIRYILLMKEHGKDFLIIGNINEMVCKDIFPMFKDGSIRYGENKVKNFTGPDGPRKFGNTAWFTNMGKHADTVPVPASKSYALCGDRDTVYPKYDGYNAIDVGKVRDIPYDYYGEMGVPLSYLTVHDPDRFDLVGVDRYVIPKEYQVGGRAAVNGKGKFPRVIIRRKI